MTGENYMQCKFQCPQVALSEHSPPIHFQSVYGCFLDTMEKLNNCDGDQMVHEAKNIYHLSLYRKSLLTSVLSAQGKYLTPTLPISIAFFQVWESRRFLTIPFRKYKSMQSLISRMG